MTTPTREDIHRELEGEGREELLERVVNARFALAATNEEIVRFMRKRDAWQALAVELAEKVRLTPMDRTAIVNGALDRIVALGDDTHAVLEQVTKAKR